MKTYKLTLKVDDRNEFQSHGTRLTKVIVDLLQKYYGSVEEFVEEVWTQQFVEEFHWRNVVSGVLGVDLTRKTSRAAAQQKLREE